MLTSRRLGFTVMLLAALALGAVTVATSPSFLTGDGICGGLDTTTSGVALEASTPGQRHHRHRLNAATRRCAAPPGKGYRRRRRVRNFRAVHPQRRRHAAPR